MNLHELESALEQRDSRHVANAGGICSSGSSARPPALRRLPACPEAPPPLGNGLALVLLLNELPRQELVDTGR